MSKAKEKSKKSGIEADHIKSGQQILSSGKAGCIVLAGGMGSRLGVDSPKGCFPITSVKKKSLFERIAEKCKAASSLYGRDLLLAVMTSPANHLQILDYFKSHQFFGIKNQISFFSQYELPTYDIQGNFISTSPSGNGDVFHAFSHSGILQEWKKRGVALITVVPIDNPLANPFDAKFLGFHASEIRDFSLIAVEKKNPNEKVGVLVVKNGKITISEYSEKKEESSLANTGILCFEMNFFEKMAQIKLPLHTAVKKVMKEGVEVEVHRFERFIFDVFPFADKGGVILYPRQSCFAPLKNFQGEDSIAGCEKAIQDYDREVFEEITGWKLGQRCELSPAFYYPTEQLLEKWTALKDFEPSEYIEA